MFHNKLLRTQVVTDKIWVLYSHNDNDIYIYISTSILHDTGNFYIVAPFPASINREPHVVEIWLFTRTLYGLLP